MFNVALPTSKNQLQHVPTSFQHSTAIYTAFCFLFGSGLASKHFLFVASCDQVLGRILVPQFCETKHDDVSKRIALGKGASHMSGE